MKTINDHIKISLLILIVLTAIDIGAGTKAPMFTSIPPIPQPIPASSPFFLMATPAMVISGMPTNVTFTVYNNGTLVSGATITLSVNETGAGITDANGTVTICVKTSVGAITVIVSKPGYENTTYPAFLTAITVPSEEWNRTFGATGFDDAKSIQLTSDGGYILAGSTEGSNGYASWLIKTDADGNQIWNRTFGGRKTGADGASSVQQTRDGGYIIAGGKDFSPINHSSKIWVIKTDINGNQQWDKTFTGEESWASSIHQTRDGGYIIAGSYDAYFGGAWLIKTSSNGTEQWNRIFNGQFLSANSVQQTSDGGYIITGRIYRNYYAAWLTRTNADGNEEWNRTFGGTLSDQDYANDVKQTLDGGYIIAGRTESALKRSAWLIKTDANGSQQWKKTFGFQGTELIANPHEFKSVELCSDGGYIIAGEIYENGTADVWLIKTDANGSLQWNKTFGGSNSDYANAVKQTPDGGYILAGHTNSYGAGDADAWLIKVSTEQNVFEETLETNCTETPLSNPTQALAIVPAKTNTTIPPEKTAGFQFALAITILLAVYVTGRKIR